MDTPLKQDDIDLLLSEIFYRTGYDFRNYSERSIRNRLMRILLAEKMTELHHLIAKVKSDGYSAYKLVKNLTIQVTTMFRDPHFFHFIRTQIIPIIKEQPFIRIWIAGCSTGEEAYSLAIIMHEEGIYERCRIYATDINESTLYQAKEGRIPATRMGQYAINYIASGGERDFSAYFTPYEDNLYVQPHLLSRILFARHNLAIDRTFNEFHLIFCRNVLIYFNRSLQSRAHGLFYDSLALHGYLALGDKESIRFSQHASGYSSINTREKIYRRDI